MDAPAVAVAADGKKRAAAWMDTRSGGDKNVYWSEGFTTDAMIHTEAKGRQGHPALVYDERGGLYAAWEDERSGRPQIYLMTPQKPKGNVLASGDDRNAGYPSLALGGGMVVLVYECDRGVVFRKLSS